MVRRHVLAALAAGIAAGDEDVARAAIGRIDPVLRGVARRRLASALIDAALVVSEVDRHALPRDPADAARHVQRIAALAVLGEPAVAPGDPSSVLAAYHREQRPPGSRLPIATIASGLAGLGLCAAFAVYIFTRPGPAAKTYVAPAPPPSVGAFKTGGVPLRDAAIEHLLAEPLPRLVIAVDHQDADDSANEHHRLITELRAAPELRAHGPALATAWTTLLDQLDQWPAHPTEAQAQAHGATLIATARRMSDELAGAGLGYLIEGDVYGGENPQAALFVYRIEQVAFVIAAGLPRRVVTARRIDHLNIEHTMLGMQSSELADPVLLYEQIDHHVATQVIPVVAPDAPFPLLEQGWTGSAETQALQLAAGAAVRTELRAALGADADVTVQIGALLRERTDIVDQWRDALARRRLQIVDTDDLFLPENMVSQLSGLVPHYQSERVTAIEEELAKLEAPRIASRCNELVAATVRRHEAEHGVDGDRKTPLRYPAALEAETGDVNDGDGNPRGLVRHARAELNAWLSQIANDPVTPQLVVWDLAGHAFAKPGWGSPESYVAVVVLSGLAKQLGATLPGPMIHDGEIDRDRLAVASMVIAKTSDADLRRAATALWTELYGEPLVVVTDR